MDPFRCASVIVCGALGHVVEGYHAIGQAVEKAGLKGSGEFREWYFHFEGDNSPNCVTQIMHGILE